MTKSTFGPNVVVVILAGLADLNAPFKWMSWRLLFDKVNGFLNYWSAFILIAEILITLIKFIL